MAGEHAAVSGVAPPGAAENDPDWEGQWGPKEVDPNDVTALTLHIRSRRRNAVLGVFGGIVLVIALAVTKYYNDRKYSGDGMVAGKSDVVSGEADALPDAVMADAASLDRTVADVLSDAHSSAETAVNALNMGDGQGAAARDLVASSDASNAAGGPDVVTADAVMPAVAPDAVPASDVVSADPVEQGDVSEGTAKMADLKSGTVKPVDEKQPEEKKPKEKQPEEKKPKEKKPKEKKPKEKKPRDVASSDRGDDDGDVSGSFDSLMAKGDKARKSRNYSKALKYFKKARSMKPSYAEPNYKVAECHRSMGNCSAAVGFYDKAISISGFRNAYIGIAKCYRQMGDKASAKKYLKKGIEKYNDGIMRLMLEKLQ